MPNRQVFVPLPDRLYAQAMETAEMQGVTLPHLLTEALSESIERLQRKGWIAKRTQPLAERGLHLVV